MMVICGTCVAVLEAEGPFFIARRTKNAPTMYFFILTLVFINTIIVYIRINREAGFWREGKSTTMRHLWSGCGGMFCWRSFLGNPFFD